MFDSQNGRGKELEAYNLLKAYHLRAIDNETTQIHITNEKKEIDRQWETAVLMKTYGADYPLLKYLVNELYRIRQWSRQKRGLPFSKAKIKEFKGIQFDKSQLSLPLHNHSFLLYMYLNETLNVAHRSSAGDNGQNPFVFINMDIINGKVFFSYIQTYVSSYNYLFKSKINEINPLNQFRKDFDKYCLKYDGAYRTGDTYVREVYVALVLAMYDRFGEEYVARWYKILYAIAYRKRLEYESVFYSTIADYPIPYFGIIASAIDALGLEPLINESLKSIDCKKLGRREYEIAKFIVKNGTEIKAVKNNLTVGDRKFEIGDNITKEFFEDGEM